MKLTCIYRGVERMDDWWGVSLVLKVTCFKKLCSSKPETFTGFVNGKQQAFLKLFLRWILREVQLVKTAVEQEEMREN